MSELTQDQINAWKSLAEKATKGPWEADAFRSQDVHRSYWWVGVKHKGGQISLDVTPDSAHEAAEWALFYDLRHADHDAAFIAASREAVPALIAEVEQLNADNNALAIGQCFHTDGKTGLTYDEHGKDCCAKDATIATLTARVAELEAASVFVSTGVKDANGDVIHLGDRVVCKNKSSRTKKEYWNPEYEVVWEAPSFTLKHVGGGLDIGSHNFNLKHGGGNGFLFIVKRGRAWLGGKP